MNIKGSIKDNLDKKDVEEVKEILSDILSYYCSPSFGSISKRDFEIFLFNKLLELGIIDENPFNIARRLGISPTRARTLLMEIGIRYKTENQLEEKLKKVFAEKIFDNLEKNLVSIEIRDPAVKEYFTNKLYEKGIISDTSFNRNMVVIKLDAFINILSDYVDEKSKKKIIKELNKEIEEGIDTKKLLRIAIEELVKGGSRRMGEFIAEFIFRSAVL